MKDVIGQMHLGRVPILVLETPLNPTELALDHVPQLELAVDSVHTSFTLADVRRLKQLLGLAEQRLLLRDKQAAYARNGTLDL